MEAALQHRWDVSPSEARAIQTELAAHVVTEDRLPAVARVAGVDVGFPERGRMTQAAVSVLSFPGLELLEEVVTRRATSFPYVPGLLSFREIPAILDALDCLGSPPDLLLCDGQGIAHPRRLGIASHLGLLTDRPAIGVAKSRLIGHQEAVPEQRGAWVPLLDEGEVIGAALRTRARVRSVFVSSGHRIALATAIEYVLGCSPRYRLPEPIRRADRLASAR